MNIRTVVIIALLCITQVLFALDNDSIKGRWRLMYPGSYGYEFRLYDNYRAFVIVYMQNRATVFKGVYAVENGNRLTINITDMKSEGSFARCELPAGFVRTSSSRFVFSATSPSSGVLIVKPVSIQIDGQSSEGYFEPEIKLTRY